MLNDVIDKCCRAILSEPGIEGAVSLGGCISRYLNLLNAVVRIAMYLVYSGEYLPKGYFIVKYCRVDLDF